MDAEKSLDAKVERLLDSLAVGAMACRTTDHWTDHGTDHC